MAAASASSQARSRRPVGARQKSRRSERAARAARRAGAGAGVRWDRVGRVAMLCVLAALAYLYLSAGIHMFSTWRQSHRDSTAVAAMEHEHRLLTRQHETLSKPSTLEEEARQLGMMKQGEQSYAVGNLPND
jgi:hypothetical protein